MTKSKVFFAFSAFAIFALPAAAHAQDVAKQLDRTNKALTDNMHVEANLQDIRTANQNFFLMATARMLSPDLTNDTVAKAPADHTGADEYTEGQLGLLGALSGIISRDCSDIAKYGKSGCIMAELLAATQGDIDQMTPKQLEAYRHQLAAEHDHLDQQIALLEKKIGKLSVRQKTLATKILDRLLTDTTRQVAKASGKGTITVGVAAAVSGRQDKEFAAGATFAVKAAALNGHGIGQGEVTTVHENTETGQGEATQVQRVAVAAGADVVIPPQ